MKIVPTLKRKPRFCFPRGPRNPPKIDQKSILRAFCVEVFFRHPLRRLSEASRSPLGGDLRGKKYFWPSSWPQVGPRTGPKRDKKLTKNGVYVKIPLGTQLGAILGSFWGRFWGRFGVHFEMFSKCFFLLAFFVLGSFWSVFSCVWTLLFLCLHCC